MILVENIDFKEKLAQSIEDKFPQKIAENGRRETGLIVAVFLLPSLCIGIKLAIFRFSGNSGNRRFFEKALKTTQKVQVEIF